MSSNRTPWALSATATWTCLWVSTPTTTFSPRCCCGILLLTAFLIRRWSFRVVGREDRTVKGNCLRPGSYQVTARPANPSLQTAATVDRSTPGHEVSRKQESNHHGGAHIIT